MSRYKTSFSPLLFLSFLHQRYVFRKPSFPEQLCHVLYPFPPFPSMKITLIKHSWWQNWFVLQQQQIIGCECFKIIESLQTLVKALSFNIASASQRTVWRPSSSKACFLRTETKILLMERMRRSHTSLWWDAARTLTSHLMPSWIKAFWILA